MNLSRLLTYVKIKLGLTAIALPFDNVDETLEQIITTVTLPTFSTYCPWYEIIRLNLKDDCQLLSKENNRAVYLLPDVFNDRPIMFIRNIDYPDDGISALGPWNGIPMSGMLTNNVMIASANMNVANQLVPRLNFRFLPPRTVELYNIIHSYDLRFELAFAHPDNLSTITPTMEESFKTLALMDIKEALYNVMKHYDNLSSAFGSIQLHLDDWSQAASERQQLLEQWDSTYHMDVQPYKFSS